MADRNQIDEIKRKLNIVDVVKEYVPTLKKAGRNHFGLCPFHNEKSPSFSVNDDLGIYKCFGCGESGDVITFIENIEGIDFIKALELSAKRAGVELQKNYSPQNKAKQQEKERLLEANTLAAKYFQYILSDHKLGAAAREYAKKRNLQQTEIKKFLIGFAPDGFQNLSTFLKKKGFSEKELINWGLLAEKNGRSYDKFRARLMFPIFNNVGDIVGFSGRIVDKEDKGPKYLNSPETPVYRKSELLYGLFQAKNSIRKLNEVILVEGNIDILSSHAANIENIVAPLGTALTVEQLKILDRYVDVVKIAFDSDPAGQKALLRALELVSNNNFSFDLKVIDLGDYQDVDELINAGENWQELANAGDDPVEYFIKKLEKKNDLSKAEGKITLQRQVFKIIDLVKEPVKIQHYLTELANRLNLTYKIIRDEYAKHSAGSSTDIPEVTEVKTTISKKLNSEERLFVDLLNNFEYLRELDESWFEDIFTDTYIQKLTKKLLRGTEPKNLIEEDNQEQLKEYMLAKAGDYENSTAFVHDVRIATIILRKDKISRLRYDDPAQVAKIAKEKSALERELKQLTSRSV